MKTLLLSLGVIAFAIASEAQTFYVSPLGNDTFPGTIDSSFRTIPRALAALQSGGTLYLRGGTYHIDSTIGLATSGSANAVFHLQAYAAEQPVLDCSSMSIAGTNRGIVVSGNYWHIRGIVIRRAGDNGMYITGSNNIIEQCTFEGNADTGLQLNNGASNNQIINCDSFDNADPKQGNADGFAAKLAVGTGNSFYGCRSWQNSDDGWDGYLRGSNGVTTTLDNCWSFMNGYLSNGSPSSGNGNGFKMGGSDSANLEHNAILTRCVAFDNLAKGFDQNHDRGSMTLLNCSAYRNATNYSLPEPIDAGRSMTLTNCLSLGFYGSVAPFAALTTNSWMSPFAVSDADFTSLDTTGMRGPRKADGNLPDVAFLHLARGSGLIDNGTDVGLPFNGPMPDLGAFESDFPSSAPAVSGLPATFRLQQNYPNPFNPKTVISGQWTVDSFVRLAVYDVLGREVAVLASGSYPAGRYSFTFDGTNLASGIYLCKLNAGSYSAIRKMLLIR